MELPSLKTLKQILKYNLFLLTNRIFEVQANTFSPKTLLKREKYGNFGKRSDTNGGEDEELCWTPILVSKLNRISPTNHSVCNVYWTKSLVPNEFFLCVTVTLITCNGQKYLLLSSF